MIFCILKLSLTVLLSLTITQNISGTQRKGFGREVKQ